MRKSRFSLIELLAVIGVIAFLTAIAFPAFRLGQTAFKKASVRSKINALTMAVTAYKATYGVFPATFNNAANTTGSELIKTTYYQTLRDILGGENARKINFLGGDNLNIGEKGLSTGTLFNDYWSSTGKEVAEKDGNKFIIYMDVYNYNNQIDGPAGTQGAPVLIYSYGPNGKTDGGGGDDIVSWKK